MNDDPESIERWVRDAHRLELEAELLADPLAAARRIADTAREASRPLGVGAAPGDFDLLFASLAAPSDER